MRLGGRGSGRVGLGGRTVATGPHSSGPTASAGSDSAKGLWYLTCAGTAEWARKGWVDVQWNSTEAAEWALCHPGLTARWWQLSVKVNCAKGLNISYVCWGLGPHGVEVRLQLPLSRVRRRNLNKPTNQHTRMWGRMWGIFEGFLATLRADDTSGKLIMLWCAVRTPVAFSDRFR